MQTQLGRPDSQGLLHHRRLESPVGSLTKLVVNTGCSLGPQLGQHTGTLTLCLSVQLCGLTLKGLGFGSKHLERARQDAAALCIMYAPVWSYICPISRKGTRPCPSRRKRCQDHIAKLIGNACSHLQKIQLPSQPLATVLHMPLTCKTLVPSSKPTALIPP